jgi:hypothetical protein
MSPGIFGRICSSETIFGSRFVQNDSQALISAAADAREYASHGQDGRATK